MKPANDNNERPPRYDELLVAYMPFAKKCAAQFGHGDDVEEIVQDFYVDACRRWASYDTRYKFGTWVFHVVRNVAQNRRNYRAADKRGAHTVGLEVVVRMDNGGASDEYAVERHCLAVPPAQEDYIELSQALARLSSRAGHVVLRQAMGDSLVEIGREMGVTCERARQLAEQERGRLSRLARRGGIRASNRVAA